METNLGKGSLGAARQKGKQMEEGKWELGWLHEKISCAVQSHAKEEEMIKITAYINIKSQIKEDVASIKKLSIAIKNRMSDIIADAKKDIQEKEEEEAVEKEKTLTDIGKEIKILEEKERETIMAIEVAREQVENNRHILPISRYKLMGLPDSMDFNKENKHFIETEMESLREGLVYP